MDNIHPCLQKLRQQSSVLLKSLLMFILTLENKGHCVCKQLLKPVLLCGYQFSEYKRLVQSRRYKYCEQSPLSVFKPYNQIVQYDLRAGNTFQLFSVETTHVIFSESINMQFNPSLLQFTILKFIVKTSHIFCLCLHIAWAVLTSIKNDLI